MGLRGTKWQELVHGMHVVGLVVVMQYYICPTAICGETLVEAARSEPGGIAGAVADAIIWRDDKRVLRDPTSERGVLVDLYTECCCS